MRENVETIPVAAGRDTGLRQVTGYHEAQTWEFGAQTGDRLAKATLEMSRFGQAQWPRLCLLAWYPVTNLTFTVTSGRTLFCR